MDDDFSFGASVWGTTDDPVPPIPSSQTTTTVYSSAHDLNGFAEFDDFAAPNDTTSAADPDDEFGDFGDFENTTDPGRAYISVFRESHTTAVVFIILPGPLAGRVGPLTLELDRLRHRHTAI